MSFQATQSTSHWEKHVLSKVREGQSSAFPTSRLKQSTMPLNLSAWPWSENAPVELIELGVGEETFSVGPAALASP